MMNHFQQQALEALSSLEALLSEVSIRASKKAIHDLRVDIKRLRAYHALLQPECTFKKAFPHLIKLNKQAQQLRDKQVMQKALRSLPAWSDDSALAQQLRKEIIDQQQSLIARLKKDVFQKRLQQDIKQLRKLVHHATYKALKASFKQQHEEHPLDPGTTDWHHLRKQWKQEWFEIEAVYGKDIPVILTRKHYPGQKLPHQLGNWHDWLIICQYIADNRKLLKKADYYLLKQQAQHKLSLWENRIRPSLQAIQP